MKEKLAKNERRCVGWLTVLALAGLAAAQSSAPQVAKVSRPGHYAGYSTPMFDGWVRSSQYVPVSDGTRLAVDIYRPSTGGQAGTTPYPVLFQMTQYRRASYQPDGTMRLIAQPMLDIVKYGYVVIVADARGEGASFGTRHAAWDRTEARDARDLIEWAAAQPWSTGSVGMWGGSYMGGIQFMAASLKPPHLKAIFAQVTPFNVFDSFMTVVPPAGPFYEPGNPATTDLLTVPVDEDTDKSMLHAAIEEHKKNMLPGPLPYRDSTWDGTEPYQTFSVSNYLTVIGDSHIAIYNSGYWGNWLREGSVLSFRNFKNPSRLALVDGDMMKNSPAFSMFEEQLRFFDAWLKDVPNGIREEAPVSYAIRNTKAEGEVRSSAIWPPAGKESDFYFGAELGLGPAKPRAIEGKDTYAVDYAMAYSDLETKGKVYTSSPMNEALDLVGNPSMELWMSSTATDNDIYVTVEAVHQDQKVEMITEGKLRASYRKVLAPPFDNAGEPWHRGDKDDVVPLTPGLATKLDIELLPLAYHLAAGDRLRVVITGAAPKNAPPGTGSFRADTPVVTPAPVLSFYRDAEHSSRLILPVIPSR